MPKSAGPVAIGPLEKSLFIGTPGTEDCCGEPKPLIEK